MAHAALASVPILLHLFFVRRDLARYRPGRTVLLITLGIQRGAGAPIGSALFYLGAQLLALSIIGVGVVLLPLGYTFVQRSRRPVGASYRGQS